MPPADRIVSRRSLLAVAAGIAGGVALAAAAGASGAYDWADPQAPGIEPAPRRRGDYKADVPSSRQPTAPQGGLSVPPPRREFYSKPGASGRQTFGDLYLPASANTSMPVVVLVHGGGWEQGLGLDYMDTMARDLASFDIAVWNVEYRRAGYGGGWPTTVADVCDAVDHVPALSRSLSGRMDLGRVVVCGHSAGGHLALWLAARERLPEDMPGAGPRQRVTGCVSLAGVTDLLRAEQTGDHFVHDFLGGPPSEVRQRYVDASPISHLPTGVPVACLHGSDDQVVHVEQSEMYVRAARRAGDDARLEIVQGGRHDPWGDLKAEPWRQAREIILGMVGLPGADAPARR